MFRVFDQISFYAITEAELDAAQASGTQGDLVQVEDGVLDLAAHEAWVDANREGISATVAQRARAIEAAPFLGELTRPRLAVDAADDGGEQAGEEVDEAGDEDGCESVKAGIPGRCWRLSVKEGDKVKAGSVLVSLRLSHMSSFHGISPVWTRILFSVVIHLEWNQANRLLFPRRPTLSHARWKS